MDQERVGTPPCLMTIFGATGDLTKRLLLPSIYNLVAQKLLPDNFLLLGVAVDAWSDEAFREHIEQSLGRFWGADADPAVIEWLKNRAHYQQADFDNAAAFDAVQREVLKLEQQEHTGGNRLFYLAVAPSFIGSLAMQLSRVGLLTEEAGSWRRLVIEKPFGHDLPSAIALNAELQKSLREDQIYRIDHFAGKDSVRDLAVFRFSNAVIEPLWHRSLIDNVQITVAETVGVEERAGYYDKSGAVRDMVPNHLAELLSLVAMEPPISFGAEDMRNKQVELLASVRRTKAEEVGRYAVRGQYGAGQIAGTPVAGYREEPNVPAESITETFAAMHVEIDNWRWSGVPFYLRTGKRMTQALTEIVVTFRQPPERLFANTEWSDHFANQLTFNLQPNQQIDLGFGARSPGIDTTVRRQVMGFQFPTGPFGTHGMGYEALLRDAMLGDATLFQSAEFVEQGWKLVQPLLEAWQAAPTEPFPNYAAGSEGPKEADDLLAATGHEWRALEQA